MQINKQKTIQFLRFCTVGLGNTAVDFTIFFLLTSVGLPYLVAQVISFSAGIANSFLLNRKWTFRVHRKTNISDVAKFVLINGLSLLLTSSLLYVLHDVNHLNLWLGKVISAGCGIVITFLGSRLWVFADNQTRSENR